MPDFSHLIQMLPSFLKTKWAIGAGALVIVVLGYLFLAHSGKGAYEFVSVSRGSVTEVVSVTGNTTPVSSVSLGFGSGGIVSRIFASVGDHVFSGALLAELNMSDLAAQLKQAQADVDAQNAKLAGLAAGSRPEDIAAAQAAYDKGVQDLANLYGTVSDIANDSYAKANDAVRVQIAPFFSNAETQPRLTFSTSNSQTGISSESGRLAAGTVLTLWQSDLPGVTSSSAQGDLDAAVQTDLTRLSTLRSFLQNISNALNGASTLDPTTLATYKANLASAYTELNTAIKNLNTVFQSIASQKLTVSQLKAELDLKKAGSTPQDIDAQKAQVENAQASVQSIEAKMQNSEIFAPQSGIVTQFDAKVGQVATAGAALISIISDSSFEVDAEVPETDIGKISVGNAVSMTLDAFPGETFRGKVFYIDPAQTLTSGVVNYKVKISFNAADSRLKSGLTANLDIETKHKDDVLVLPEYAILVNDKGTFVRVLEKGVTKDIPVILGIQDAKGNTEVASGVTEGQKVINIGLKQP